MQYSNSTLQEFIISALSLSFMSITPLIYTPLQLGVSSLLFVIFVF